MLTGTCHCGETGWTFDGMPPSVTACNCTLCRRYGVLWIYDFEDQKIKVSGPTRVYVRKDNPEPALEVHFCGNCGCVVAWKAVGDPPGTPRRVAVNLRLSEPGPVQDLPIDHFDGLTTFDDLPGDGRCVRDLWF